MPRMRNTIASSAVGVLVGDQLRSMIMVERFPFHAQVSLSEETMAEVTYLARLDDRSESATIRKLIEIALAVLKQQHQQPAQPNGARQPQEHRDGVRL
jgi:hypothetical protein